MVKRDVRTKVCLLGKAVSCNYLQKGNFIEVPSSTVASVSESWVRDSDPNALGVSLQKAKKASVANLPDPDSYKWLL